MELGNQTGRPMTGEKMWRFRHPFVWDLLGHDGGAAIFPGGSQPERP